MELKLEELQKICTEILSEVVSICNRHNIQYYLVYGSALGAVRHGGPIPWDYDVDIAVPYPELERYIAALRKELSDKYYLNFNDNDPYYPELLPRVGLKGYSTKTLHIDTFLLIGAPDDSKKHFWFKNWSKLYFLVFKFKNFNEVHFGKFTTLRQKIFVPIIRLMFSPFSNRLIKEKFKKHCEKHPFHQAKYIVNPQFGYNMKEFLPREYYGEGKEIDYSNITVKIPEQIENYLTHIYGDYMQLPPESSRIVPEHYVIDERESP